MASYTIAALCAFGSAAAFAVALDIDQAQATPAIIAFLVLSLILRRTARAAKAHDHQSPSDSLGHVQTKAEGAGTLWQRFRTGVSSVHDRQTLLLTVSAVLLAAALGLWIVRFLP